MIVSKTPLRISFAGGGTDLPSFYRHNGYGAVFSTSINRYIYVILKSHSELYPEKIRLNYSETEQVNDIEDIENPIIRECLKFLAIDEKLYICTVADAPGSSGLGSSSTFCVGLLNALYRHRGEAVSRSQLAEEAAHIEIDVLGRPIGKQDHYAAALGGMNYIKFCDDGSTMLLPAVVEPSVTRAIFSSLLTFWTGIARSSSSILTEQNRNNAANADLLIEIRKQAEQMYELCVNKQFSIRDFGALMHEGWAMKKKLATNISNEFIDAAYECAKKMGAYGGKISGAGNGGFLNVVSPAEHAQEITTALAEMGLVPFDVGPDTAGTTVNTYE